MDWQFYLRKYTRPLEPSDANSLYSSDLHVVWGRFVSVRVINQGWPDLPAIPEAEAPEPPRGHLGFLVDFMVEDGFAQTAIHYQTRFLDFESEVIRAAYNRHRGLNDYRPILSKEEWDLLMDYCAHIRRLWT